MIRSATTEQRRDAQRLKLFGLCWLLVQSACWGGNIAYWHQTSSGFAPKSDNMRDRLAFWPHEIATNLTILPQLQGPVEMQPRLQEILNHALSVWESAADIRFVQIDDMQRARMVVTLKYSPGKGYYHGSGNAGPPGRVANGEFKKSWVNLNYGGEPAPVVSWREDPWVWVAVHELGHALGFWHEFERPDRDQYLRLVRPSGRIEMLPVRTNEIGYTAGLPFDYASVIMYAWADNDRNPPWRFTQPGTQLERVATISYEQRNGLSPLDVLTVQWAYGKPADSLKKPMIHRPPVPDPTLWRNLQQKGWVVMPAKGANIYGCNGAVVFEAEYGAFDHWTQGGSPPRLQKKVAGNLLDFSADLEATYLPPGTCAGLFIVFGPQAWVYFGPCDHILRVVAQQTGHEQSKPCSPASNRYRLRAHYAEGRLQLFCRSEPAVSQTAINSAGPAESLVQSFDNLPRPGYIAIGMKTWANESAYRNVRFRNISD